MLRQSFAQSLRDLSIACNTRIAVAVSGGADSVALLSLATQWARPGAQVRGDLPQSPVAFVVDHSLRKDSAREARHACDLAQQLGVQFRLIKLENSASWPPPDKSGLLSAARQLRYQRLYQECCSLSINVLLTGHHSGDQAENFLIRLSRGSGIDGLAGIEPISYLSAGPGTPQVQLVRPLLQISKQTLQQHCQNEGLTWVEDPTNRDTAYLRNLVRARLATHTCSFPQSTDSIGSSQNLRKRQSSREILPEQCKAVREGFTEGKASGSPQLATVQPISIQHADSQRGKSRSAEEVQLPVTDRATATSTKGQPEADPVGDILFLSKVCSAAKHSLQQEAQELVAKMVNTSPGTSNSLYEQSEAAETNGQLLFSEAAQEHSGQNLSMQNGASPGRKQHADLDCSTINLKPLEGKQPSLVLRVLAMLLKTGKGLPPKLSTLQQAWKAVRTGALKSPYGKVPKRMDFEGCYLCPVRKTSGQLVTVHRK